MADVLKQVARSDAPRVLIVADLNVVQRNEGIGSKIGRYVQAHGIRLAGSPVVIAGGEKAKADNLQSALKVISAILSAQLGRNWPSAAAPSSTWRAMRPRRREAGFRSSGCRRRRRR